MNKENKNIFSGLTLKYIEVNENEEKRVYEDNVGIEHIYIKNYDVPNVNNYIKIRKIEEELEILKECDYNDYNCMTFINKVEKILKGSDKDE